MPQAPQISRLESDALAAQLIPRIRRFATLDSMEIRTQPNGLIVMAVINHQSVAILLPPSATISYDAAAEALLHEALVPASFAEAPDIIESNRPVSLTKGTPTHLLH